MSTYRDEAIVLRKLDFKEQDRIYTLLTKEHGKVGAIAKGVRQPTSRLAGALELFGRIDVQLARGRSLDIITQVVRLDGRRIAAEVERTAHAALVAELADRVSEDRHPLEGVFNLTAAALAEIAEEEDPRRATAWFLTVALDLLGYSPRLDVCGSCGRPLPEAPAAFAPEAGAFLCASCRTSELPLTSVPALKVLRLLAAGDVALYRRLKLEETLLTEVDRVLSAQLEHHLDRQLRSLRFLRQMRLPA